MAIILACETISCCADYYQGLDEFDNIVNNVILKGFGVVAPILLIVGFLYMIPPELEPKGEANSACGRGECRPSDKTDKSTAVSDKLKKVGETILEPAKSILGIFNEPEYEHKQQLQRELYKHQRDMAQMGNQYKSLG